MMKKLLATIIIFAVLTLIACGPNEPAPGDYDFIGPLEEEMTDE